MDTKTEILDERQQLGLTGGADHLGDSLTDPLDGSWSVGRSSRSSSSEESSYEEEERGEKQSGPMDMKTKEFWATGSSTRSTWRPNKKDEASAGSSLFGADDENDNVSDAASIWNPLGKGVKSLGNSVKNSSLGKKVGKGASALSKGAKKLGGNISERVGDEVDTVTSSGERGAAKLKRQLGMGNKPTSYDPDEGTPDDESESEAKARKKAAKARKKARKKAGKERKKKREKSEKKEADEAKTSAARVRDYERRQSGKKSMNSQERKDRARSHGKKKSGGTKAKLNKVGINTSSLAFGGLGDESGMDIGNFNRDRSGDNWSGVNSASEKSSFTATDGSKHSVDKATARLGISSGTDIYAKRQTATEMDEAGANSSASVDYSVEASVSSYEGKGKAGSRARSSFRAGASAAAAAGARSTRKLGGRLNSVAEAGAETDTFVGIDGEANSSVEAGTGYAKTAANVRAGIGARIKGKGGANAALKVGGTDLLAARVKGNGEAFAGAEAGAEGEAQAHILKGLSAKGEAEAKAGAEAQGKVSAGVTAGFVDGDVKAQGKAFAGAKAGAEGGVKLSPAGIVAGGKASAFAGAKAEGEIGFELGGAGLNAIEFVVRGKAQAGAGGNAGFQLEAIAGKLAMGAEAGAAVGVGLGAGVQFKGDVLFPLRVVIDQVAKNGAAIAADSAAADVNNMKWLEKGTQHDALSPAAELVEAGKTQASEEIRTAVEEVGNVGNTALTRGTAMLSEVGPALLQGMFQAESAHAEAKGTIDRLLASAGQQAGAAVQTLGAVADSCLAELGGLLTTPIWELLTVDFETQVERVIERIHAITEKIKAGILAIIERTEEMIIEVGTRFGEVILAPLKAMADVVGSVIAEFGGELLGSGYKMVDLLGMAFGRAETGVPIEGVEDTSLVIPAPVTPKLGEVTGVLGQADSFFSNAGQGGFGKVVEELAAPVMNGALVEAPAALAKNARQVVEDFNTQHEAVVVPVEKGARQVAKDLAPAVDAAREFALNIARMFGLPMPEAPAKGAAGPATGAAAAIGPALGAAPGGARAGAAPAAAMDVLGG